MNKRLKMLVAGIIAASSILTVSQPVLAVESDNIEVVNEQYMYGGPTIFDELNKNANIPDKNLRAALNKKLGQDSDAEITVGDLRRIFSLELNNMNISDLTGLEHCTGLTKFSLDGIKNIPDLEPIVNLKNLYELSLKNCNITDLNDISEITKLPNIFKIDLSNNNISDLTSISVLDNVITNRANYFALILDGNQISDFSALSRYEKIFSLSLKDNNISDVSSLEGVNCNWLDLSRNNITDRYSLSKLSFGTLFLSNNPISKGDEKISYNTILIFIGDLIDKQSFKLISGDEISNIIFALANGTSSDKVKTFINNFNSVNGVCEEIVKGDTTTEFKFKVASEVGRSPEYVCFSVVVDNNDTENLQILNENFGKSIVDNNEDNSNEVVEDSSNEVVEDNSNEVVEDSSDNVVQDNLNNKVEDKVDLVATDKVNKNNSISSDKNSTISKLETPKTGYAVGSSLLVLMGGALSGIGAVLTRRKEK